MDGNGMILLILFIFSMAGLVYMIVLSNEMSTLIDRLLGRTKRLMNKIDKINHEKDEYSRYSRLSKQLEKLTSALARALEIQENE